MTRPLSGYYWLSFVDRIDGDIALPIGVAIVRADDFLDAVQVSWRRRCNPGGEVAGTLLPHQTIPAALLDQLLTEPGDIADAQLALTIREEP